MAKTPRQKIVAKLDKIVSEIVILRDKKCVLCGSKNRLGSGHIFSRIAYSTRWDLTEDGNVHVQCWPCNYRHVRDQYPYFGWYEHMYGKRNFIKLRQRFKTTVKYKTYELEDMYERLKIIRETLRDE